LDEGQNKTVVLTEIHFTAKTLRRKGNAEFLRVFVPLCEVHFTYCDPSTIDHPGAKVSARKSYVHSEPKPILVTTSYSNDVGANFLSQVLDVKFYGFMKRINFGPPDIVNNIFKGNSFMTILS
jgi:hypothetical protein